METKTAGVLLSITCATLSMAGDPEFKVTRWTIDGGGGQSAGGSFKLNGTIGQFDTGAMTGGNFEVTGGFWGAGNSHSNSDCNGNGLPDDFDISEGTSQDCNSDGLPDECEIASGQGEDCNLDLILDDCQPMKHWSGAVDSDWPTGGNWEEDEAPLDGEHACIADPSAEVLYTDITTFLASLACEGSLSIDDGFPPWPNLTLEDPSFVEGDFTLDGASSIVEVNNSLTLNGLFRWYDGTLQGTGATELRGGMLLNRSGVSLRKQHLRMLSGTFTASSEQIVLANGAQIHISEDTVYDFTGDGNIFSGSSGQIENRGVLTIAAGTGSARISTPINVTGEVRVLSGELIIASSGTHTGALVGHPATTLGLDDGPHELTATSTIDVHHLALAGADTNFRGSVNVDGNMNCLAGSQTFHAEADIIHYGENLTVAGGNIYFRAPTDEDLAFDTLTVGPGSGTYGPHFETGRPVSLRELDLNNGRISGISPIDISERFTWENGAFLSGGDMTASGAIVFEDTNNPRTLSRVMNIDGDATVHAGFSVSSSGRLEILAGSTFNIVSDASISGSGKINNAGTLTKTGAEQSTFFTDLKNTGTIRIDAGSIHLQQMNYVQKGGRTVLNGGNITSHLAGPMVIEGGLLTGIGAVGCDVRIDGGTSSPGLSAGELLIEQGYVQTSLGTLRIEIAGSNSGEFDVLTVVGDAVLGGNLEVTTIEGYIPPVGQSYHVVSASNITGTFDNVLPVIFPANRAFEVTYSSDGVFLDIVAVDVGDCDDDAGIGLTDYVCLAECLTGPALLKTPECDDMDIDGDEDIDLRDYGLFSGIFGTN